MMERLDFRQLETDARKVHHHGTGALIAPPFCKFVIARQHQFALDRIAGYSVGSGATRSNTSAINAVSQ